VVALIAQALQACRAGSAVTGVKKLRRTFTIEPDLLEKLRAIKDRTGLSESEQVRQGIRWWLESREWPARKSGPQEESAAKPGETTPRGRRRR
jgi:hypothetical protein